MPNGEENSADSTMINEKIIISSDPAKMTSRLAIEALQNNNNLFANALLNELEVLTHDGEK